MYPFPFFLVLIYITSSNIQVRGTVEQPVLDGSASFHRATVSSPVFRKPLTNFGGSVLVNSNRLSISSLEGRVSRKGKLSVKGNLPLRTVEASDGDKIDLKCEVLEVRAKNIFRYILYAFVYRKYLNVLL